MLLQSASGHLPYPVPFLPTAENPCFGFPALWEVIQPANCVAKSHCCFVLSRRTGHTMLFPLSPLTLSSTAPKQHCSRPNPTPPLTTQLTGFPLSPPLHFLLLNSFSPRAPQRKGSLLCSGQVRSALWPTAVTLGDGSQTKAAINPAQRLSHYCGLNGQGLCQNSVWLTDPADRGANAWAWPGCSFTSNGDALL